MYSEMITGDWRWDTQDQLPDGATLGPVYCAFDMTQLTNFSGDQYAWPLCLTIGDIGKDIHCTPKNRVLILVGLIPCPPKDAINIDEGWYSKVGTLLS
jgi:hypothetical protein